MTTEKEVSEAFVWDALSRMTLLELKQLETEIADARFLGIPLKPGSKPWQAIYGAAFCACYELVTALARELANLRTFDAWMPGVGGIA
ncbi:MAG: hypothetical protein WCD69_11005 [Xanthobacteraceae bacterium]